MEVTQMYYVGPESRFTRMRDADSPAILIDDTLLRFYDVRDGSVAVSVFNVIAHPFLWRWVKSRSRPCAFLLFGALAHQLTTWQRDTMSLLRQLHKEADNQPIEAICWDWEEGQIVGLVVARLGVQIQCHPFTVRGNTVQYRNLIANTKVPTFSTSWIQSVTRSFAANDDDLFPDDFSDF